jgi:hypothetical protein
MKISRLSTCLLAAALIASPMIASAKSHIPAGLAAVKTAMARYQDPIKAVHDGYLSTLGCVLMPGGGMGIHFVNLRAIGPKPDPMKPTILMYEPAGGKLRLIAVEWIVPYAPGMKGTPTLFGRKFHGPMEGHAPLLPKQFAHFDLHAWIFKKNPKGLFAEANPNVSCKGAVSYLVREKHAKKIKR